MTTLTKEQFEKFIEEYREELRRPMITFDEYMKTKSPQAQEIYKKWRESQVEKLR